MTSGDGKQNAEEKKSIGARLRSREKRTLGIDAGLAALFKSLGGESQPRLITLWKRWAEIMGDETAALGAPLGHKERTLIIGAEDAMALQELSMMGPDIAERANEFLEEDLFDGVSAVLMQGRADLAEKSLAPKESVPDKRVATAFSTRDADEAPKLGAFLGRLNPESPVTRCYEAYVRTAAKAPEETEK